ncbi:tRNA dihydrouridine synthase DusB [Kineosporia babensis]|uniref:tRNA dihydrouridine synthase DusB n=1 Tax=Kineosporia babensis TaxID=499548 RepID=A0A9X1NE96_9ACTN|nr:tRNA dihydrouridine synthase DusB [Kineosporia babensis]
MRALQVGPHRIATPVVLAPMAGITNTAFRRLCREQMAAEGGQGLFVSEMVTSRALIERNDESMRLIQHDPDENPRSVQLYGVDPGTVGACVSMLLSEDRADHIDLNFGCPVQKVTRKGGGAALPWKAGLFAAIVSAAVKAATPYGVPVTVKMRKGIDADHLSYLDAGRIAEAEGVATVALHGRTAAEYYSGQADWSAIGRLKEAVTSIPVLGNGDIWSADDAVRMMAETGADGVVVGRGCLGRPWLFADLAAGLQGRDTRRQPPLGYVLATMRRHIELLIEHYEGYEKPFKSTDRDADRNSENRACRDFRKHIAWYFKGYVVGKETRAALAMISSLAEFDDLAGQLDGSQPYPGEGAEGPRGRAGSPRPVSLPPGWLDSREIDGELAGMLREAELSVSGG